MILGLERSSVLFLPRASVQSRMGPLGGEGLLEGEEAGGPLAAWEEAEAAWEEAEAQGHSFSGVIILRLTKGDARVFIGVWKDR
jgi:hypothetical protein